VSNEERKYLKDLLERAKQALGIEDNIKLILYPMKYKVASVSLKSKNIRLNKNIIKMLTYDELYYILVHELIHIKLSSLNHGNGFYRLLHSLYTIEEIEELENRIAKKLIDTNVRAEMWLA